MSIDILTVKNLETVFYTKNGVIKAVDGVSFNVKKGKTLGIVGESGCGKSVTSMSILRLIPNENGEITKGDIIFEKESLLDKTKSEMRKIRGKKISMIFQDSMTALDPSMKIGKQITETIRAHSNLTKKEAKIKAIDLLKKIGLPSPELRINEYPHQLSGGMRQRVVIAIALSCNSNLLIADEPTTALDVTIQAQILELMKEIKNTFNTSIILITHDLGVVSEMADDIIVMYAGKVVEKADAYNIFKNPLHPYTKGLMEAIPRITDSGKTLRTIKGTVPDPLNMPKGCRFNTRCNDVMDICFKEEPPLFNIENSYVRCWKYKNTM